MRRRVTGLARRASEAGGQWLNSAILRKMPVPTRVRLVSFSLMRSFFRKQAPLSVTLQMRHQRDAAKTLRTGGPILGPLETQLLELLWARRRPATVRQIRRATPELAYTTIMTTLDRLYRKGLLLRDKDGRAFAYAARYTRAELLSELISGHVADFSHRR